MPFDTPATPQRAVRHDPVALDAAHPVWKGDRRRRDVFGQARSAVRADRVVREQGVNRRISGDPHLLESVRQVRRELANADVKEVLGAEWGIELQARVLQFNGDRAVRVFTEADLGQVRDVLAKCPRAEDVRFLRKLKVVLDARHRPLVVQRRRADVGQLDVDGERDGARDFTGPDGLRPQFLVCRSAEADRRLLDEFLRLARHAIAAQAERLSERVEFRKDDVTGLAARAVLPREGRDGVRAGCHRPDDQENEDDASGPVRYRLCDQHVPPSTYVVAGDLRNARTSRTRAGSLKNRPVFAMFERHAAHAIAACLSDNRTLVR
jgi:hypothetical protein